MTNQTDALDTVFQALADPTRRAVLARLTEGPATVSEIAAPFEMALPTLLQHIRKLEDGGLIATRKAGRVRTCELRPEALDAAGDWIAQQRAVWEARLDRLEAYLATLDPEDGDPDD